jgi:predicted nuclease of predicted toxin-antitoxin system
VFKLLADEDVHPEAAAYLRKEACDVIAVDDLDLRGSSDKQILKLALSEQRVVLTHDRDFEALTIAGGQRILWIIYLRPGHIRPEFTIETPQTVFRSSLDLTPPFLLVAIWGDNGIRVRVRRLGLVSPE